MQSMITVMAFTSYRNPSLTFVVLGQFLETIDPDCLWTCMQNGPIKQNLGECRGPELIPVHSSQPVQFGTDVED